MVREKLYKLNKIELMVYCHLGVKRFQRMILWLERHNSVRKGRRKNYHPQGKSVIAIEKFFGFLFYNSLLHIISLFFVVMYFIIIANSYISFVCMNVIMWLVFLLNIYCIMLQRFNCIRMKKCILQYYDKRECLIDNFSSTIIKNLLSCKEQDVLVDFQLITKLSMCITQGTCCILTVSDIPSLRRIKKYMFDLMLQNRGAVGLKSNIESDKSIIELLNHSMEGRYLYTILDKRVEKIQQYFHLPHTKSPLYDFYIVTESEECEMVYQGIFSSDSIEYIMLVVNILERAYKIRILGGRCMEIDVLT